MRGLQLLRDARLHLQVKTGARTIEAFDSAHFRGPYLVPPAQLFRARRL